MAWGICFTCRYLDPSGAHLRIPVPKTIGKAEANDCPAA